MTLQRPDWASGAELVAGTAMSLVEVFAILPFVPIYWTAFLGFNAVVALAFCQLVCVHAARCAHRPGHSRPCHPVSCSWPWSVGQLYSEKRQQVSEIRSAFGRFVSPAVVARLAEHPGGSSATRRPSSAILTLMFCDIRSFTTLSEGFTAVELSTFLNEYPVAPMTDIILKELGTVDKYMGDAIMAFWNAPLDLMPGCGVRTVRAAARDARRRWSRSMLNGTLARAEQNGRPFHPVKFGIGLNTGGVQCRQHGLQTAFRLFGARRRGQYRLSRLESSTSSSSASTSSLRGDARRSARFRVARNRPREAQKPDTVSAPSTRWPAERLTGRAKNSSASARSTTTFWRHTGLASLKRRYTWRPAQRSLRRPTSAASIITIKKRFAELADHELPEA